MIWAPYFGRNTIISNTCLVRYAYICADVAIIEDYCYAGCPPASPPRPHYRWSQLPTSVREIEDMYSYSTRMSGRTLGTEGHAFEVY